MTSANLEHAHYEKEHAKRTQRKDFMNTSLFQFQQLASETQQVLQNIQSKLESVNALIDAIAATI